MFTCLHQTPCLPVPKKILAILKMKRRIKLLKQKLLRSEANVGKRAVQARRKLNKIIHQVRGGDEGMTYDEDTCQKMKVSYPFRGDQTRKAIARYDDYDVGCLRNKINKLKGQLATTCSKKEDVCETLQSFQKFNEQQARELLQNTKDEIDDWMRSLESYGKGLVKGCETGK